MVEAPNGINTNEAHAEGSKIVRPTIDQINKNPDLLDQFSQGHLLRKVILEGEAHALIPDYIYGRRTKPFEVGGEIIEGSGVRVLFTRGNGCKVQDDEGNVIAVEGDIKYVGYTSDLTSIPKDLFCEGK